MVSETHLRGQYWAIAVAGALTAVLAVALDRPAFLLGTAGAWASLAGRRVAVTQAGAAVASGLSMTRTLPDVQAGQRASLEWQAVLDSPVGSPIVVEQPFPAAIRTGDDEKKNTSGERIDGDSRVTLTIPARETEVSGHVPLRFPVGGTLRLASPVASVGDGGAVTRTVPVDAGELIEPVRPRPSGGRLDRSLDRDQAAFGRAESHDRTELRPYTLFDPVGAIDWNVTGRLGETYVRDFVPETPDRVVVILDPAGATDLPVGPAGLTALDYLRDAGLAVVEEASTRDLAVGLVIVGDNGIDRSLRPAGTAERVAEVKRELRGIDPAASVRSAVQLRSDPQSVRGARSSFNGRLRPLLEEGVTDGGVVNRPVSRAARECARAFTATHYVLLTTGLDRAAVRAATTRLGRDGGVTVLFPPEEALVRYRRGRVDDVPVDSATGRARRRSVQRFRRSLVDAGSVSTATLQLAETRSEPEVGTDSASGPTTTGVNDDGSEPNRAPTEPTLDDDPEIRGPVGRFLDDWQGIPDNHVVIVLVGAGLLALALGSAAWWGWAGAGIAAAWLSLRYGAEFGFVAGVTAFFAVDPAPTPIRLGLALAGLSGILVGPAVGRPRPGAFLAGGGVALTPLAAVVVARMVRPGTPWWAVVGGLALVATSLTVAVRQYESRRSLPSTDRSNGEAEYPASPTGPGGDRR